MKTMNRARTLCVLCTAALLALSLGCGWSSPESRRNTRTGVSESGYPGGQAEDPGSPALESMRRPEKKGLTEHAPKGEPGRPSAKTENTNAPGRDKSGDRK